MSGEGSGNLATVLMPANVSKCSLGSTVEVGGRVSAVRRHGSVVFADLEWDGKRIQVVTDHRTPLRRLDIVVLQAVVQQAGDRIELHLARLLHHRSPDDRVSAGLIPLRQPEHFAAMQMRAVFEQAARASLEGQGFIAVRSPGIVGDWVQGQTGAFELKYYDRAAFLTISNMISHQMILGSGFGRIYEIGPIYRAEQPRNHHRLAEFTILDIGMAFADLQDLLLIVEKTLGVALMALSQKWPDLHVPTVPELVERIDYSRLLRDAGVEAQSGAQLPSRVRQHLAANYPGFVWVTGFPEHTRPFFVRAVDGTCLDGQLWYGGKIYLAAGGERETDLGHLLRRIAAEGKDADRYEFFLEHVRAGLPPSVGIGLGIERFLAAVVAGDTIDYATFPSIVGRLGDARLGLRA